MTTRAWGVRIVAGCSGVLLAVASGPVHAQSLRERIAAHPNATVRLVFPARAGVCAGETHTNPRYWNGRIFTGGAHPDSAEWDNGCRDAPVHAAVQFVEGRLMEVRWYVGGGWGKAAPGTVDLGAVDPSQASQALVELAAQGPQPARQGAIAAAHLAEGSNLEPMLLAIVRNAERPAEVRRWALQLLPRQSDAAVVALLESIVKTP